MFWTLILILYPVTFNGYFESEFYTEKEQNPVYWNLYTPKNYVEFKISAHPIRNGELYISLNALSNTNGTQFFFNQGHVQLNGNHSSFAIFAREDRYWVQSPLLFLVNQDRIKDDNFGPKGEGLRFDFWDIHSLFGTGLISKYKSWDGEAYIGRIGRNFGKLLTLSYMYLKKDWRGGREPSYNEINSGYMRVHIYRTLYLSGEFANSIHPNQPGKDSLSFLDKSALQIEFRRIYFKGLNISWSYFNYGRYFIDEMSNKFNPGFDHEFGREGLYGEILYLVPYKAINILYKTMRFKTWYDYPVLLPSPYTVTWNYGEIYAEFKKGVSAKIFAERTLNRKGDWKHIFFQIQGENTRMKVKLQYKIKDIGINVHKKDNDYSIGQRSILGTEMWINLTGWLQFYMRGALGNGQGLSWNTLFTQLAIRKFPNSEIFVEYGDPGATDGDLVNDPDVSDFPYQKIRDRFKILLKYWF